MITTYAGLLTRLIQLIDGEDTSVSDMAPETLAHIVNMGERRVYREVKSRHNEKAFSLAISGNLAAIPADFESASVVHFGGPALTPVPEEWLREYNQNSGTAIRFFAEAGSYFTFGAPASDDMTMQGRYFARLPDLSETTLPTNALFTAENDLFIYAALAESGGLFGKENDSRVPLWEQKYTAARDRVNLGKSRSAYSAGRLQMRSSVRLPSLPTQQSSSSSGNGYFASDYVQ